jgi:hypothetical protein
MLLAYFTRPRLDPKAPWAFGYILIGAGEPTEKLLSSLMISAPPAPPG